ncbi:MAG: TolC family protein [candidate division Zixibacteria bacterium]|nr:TolC family protein [candidate division Zixibacteria bacterium]
MRIKTTLILSILFGVIMSSVSFAETVLTVEKVRQRALEYNRQLLSAKKELDRAKAEIISARSGALPQLSLDGRYTRNLTTRELFFGDEVIPISKNNEFDLSLSLTQPLYIGGKVGSALKIAKIYREYSEEAIKQAEREVVYSAESIFYSAILAESNLDVIKKSSVVMTLSLEIAEKKFSQGMISEYELLRARVEKLNIQPQLISAESNLNLSRKRLKSFLGLPLNENVSLIADLSDTSSVNLPTLDTLIIMAINERPEIKQANLNKRGRKKAVRIAKGDWLYPNIYANATYQMTGSSGDRYFRDSERSDSWTASLTVNIPIFDGARTIGEVRKAKVDYYQAKLTEQQLLDDIKLEVEQAYDNLIQAGKALETQTETITSAEEGKRIADLRYESGIGTQLEVLSVQTALTLARTQYIQTVHSYRLAKAALKKATGFNID